MSPRVYLYRKAFKSLVKSIKSEGVFPPLKKVKFIQHLSDISSMRYPDSDGIQVELYLDAIYSVVGRADCVTSESVTDIDNFGEIMLEFDEK